MRYSSVRILVLFVVLCLLALLPRPTFAKPATRGLANIASLSLESRAQGEFGDVEFSSFAGRNVDGHIQGSGMTLSDSFVTRLLQVVSCDPVPLDGSKLFAGVDEPSDETYRAALRKWAGDGIDLPGVAAELERPLHDASVRAAWAADYYSHDVLNRFDRGRFVSLRIVYDDGTTITVASSRQQAYMLPFKVTCGDAAVDNYDPALARSIAFFGPANVNKDLLEGSGAVQALVDWFNRKNLDVIPSLVMNRFTPKLAQYVRSEGIEAKWIGLSPDLGALWGSEVWFPGWPPQLRIDLAGRGIPLNAQATQAAGLAALARARVDGSRVAGIPWIHRWLSSGPDHSVSLTPFVMEFYGSYDRSSLVKAIAHAFPRARDDVGDPQKLLAAYLFVERARVRNPSTWIVLPSGRAVLVEIGDAASAGPVPMKDYISGCVANCDTLLLVDPQGNVTRP